MCSIRMFTITRGDDRVTRLNSAHPRHVGVGSVCRPSLLSNGRDDLSQSKPSGFQEGVGSEYRLDCDRRRLSRTPEGRLDFEFY